MKCDNCSARDTTAYTPKECIEAAAWHSAQRDLLLKQARTGPSCEALTFSENWATYRNGQKTMLNGILAYLEGLGHLGIANRVRTSFDKSLLDPP